MNEHMQYLEMAFLYSKLSHDRDTKVGAVFVNKERGDYYSATNAFPEGMELQDARLSRPFKYKVMAHAEETIISLSARYGYETKGSTIYTTHAPCPACARMIVMAGISTVVSAMHKTSTSDEDIPIMREIFSECGVELIEVDYTP